MIGQMFSYTKEARAEDVRAQEDGRVAFKWRCYSWSCGHVNNSTAAAGETEGKYLCENEQKLRKVTGILLKTRAEDGQLISHNLGTISWTCPNSFCRRVNTCFAERHERDRICACERCGHHVKVTEITL